MSKLTDLLRNNRIYVYLFIFVALINLLVFAGWMAERHGKAGQAEMTSGEVRPASEQAAAEQAEPAGTTLFNDDDVKARQAKLEELASEKPLLYLFIGLFNLTILFFILLGVILDVYLIIRLIRRDPVRIRITGREEPRWVIGDIFRVVLIFLSFGYAFVIAQSFAARQLPILYNENFRMVFNTAMMNIVGIGVILYFVLKKYGQDLNAIGLTFKKIPRGIFYAAAGYIAIIPVIIGIMIATYYAAKLFEYRPPVQPIVEVFMEEKETSVLLLSAVFAAVFGPFAEEVFFRGFMYPAIRKKIGVFGGMLVTSAVFSFLHTHLVGFLPILVLGMLLAYLYEKTGSLLPSIFVHITHNLGMVALVFLMRYVGT